jgi:hypothetical protein
MRTAADVGADLLAAEPAPLAFTGRVSAIRTNAGESLPQFVADIDMEAISQSHGPRKGHGEVVRDRLMLPFPDGLEHADLMTVYSRRHDGIRSEETIVGDVIDLQVQSLETGRRQIAYRHMVFEHKFLS